MNFSERLKELRTEQQITQEALAELLDVSRQAVYKWESGKGYPKVENLLFLKQYFNISLDSLLGQENNTMKQHDTTTLWSSFQEFYLNLNRKERHGMITLAGFLIAILLFTSGITIGEYMALIL